jgi:hypothetical protein
MNLFFSSANPGVMTFPIKNGEYQYCKPLHSLTYRGLIPYTIDRACDANGFIGVIFWVVMLFVSFALMMMSIAVPFIITLSHIEISVLGFLAALFTNAILVWPIWWSIFFGWER